MTGLDAIVDRILKATPELTRESVYQLIRKKIQEMEGLLTEEGAAYVVASELGVEVKPIAIRQEVAVRDLVPGLYDVTVAGRFVFLHPATTFHRADGSKGKVARGVLADKTGTIKVVFWDSKAELVEQGKLEQGVVARIAHGYTRVGIDGRVELHIGDRASIEINPSDLDPDLFPSVEVFVKKIGELKEGDKHVYVAAIVKRAYPVKRFEGGALRRLRIADGTGTVTAVFWGRQAELMQDVREGHYLHIVGAKVRRGQKGLELHVGEDSQIRVTYHRPEEMVPPSTLPIASVREGMTGFNLLTRVVAVEGPRQYKSDEREGEIATLLVKDDSGMTELTLWNGSAAVARIIKPGDVILAEDCSAKVGPGKVIVAVLNRSGYLTINPPPAGSLRVGIHKAGIAELREGIVEVVEGTVASPPRMRTVRLRNGRQVPVVSFDLDDGTGRVTVSLWREAAQEARGLIRRSLIRIENVAVQRIGDRLELQSTRFTKVTTLEAPKELRKIAELRDGDFASVEVEVDDLLEKQYIYRACPKCLRKVSETEEGYFCSGCGKVKPVPRLAVDFRLRDETGQILATCYGDVAESALGLSATRAVKEQEPMQLLREKRESIVGRKILVRGRVVYDEFLGELKILARDFKFLDS